MLKSKQVPIEFQSKQKKYKKYHKLKPKTSVVSLTTRERGNFYCTSTVADATVKQLVAVLKLIKPKMKTFSRKSRLRFYPVVDVMLTRKPKDIRMGRGKGVPTEKVAVLKSGSPIFKLKGLKSKHSNSVYDTCLPKAFVRSSKINTSKW